MANKYLTYNNKLLTLNGKPVMVDAGSTITKTPETKTITPTTTEQIVTPTDNTYELTSVIVEAIQTEEKTTAPTTEQQEIIADNGYLSKVTIEAVTSAIDSDIIADNIRKDIDILGVVGTLEIPQIIFDDSTGTLTINYDTTNKLAQVADQTVTTITANDLYGATKIRTWLFSWNDNLTSIVIPNSVTNILNNAFTACRGLTSVIFEENSKLTQISQEAFSGCSSLTSFTIPNSVTSIGSDAFYGCTGLTTFNIYEDFNIDLYGKGLKNATNLTHDSLLDMANKIKDRTGESTKYTFHIGTTNKNKLSAEEQLIITNKNWTIS